MVLSFDYIRRGLLRPLCFALSAFIAACAAMPPVPATQFADEPDAISVPYKISAAGRFLLDVSVNGGPVQPFSIDTGATISVVYDDFAVASGLDASETTRYVRGLVGQGDRPVIENILLGIGPRQIPLEQTVLLETPVIKDEAVGLIGNDIIGNFVLLFDRQTLMATFVPKETLDRKAFAGWNKIRLRNLTDVKAQTQLFFAQMSSDGRTIPVLIDTGSSTNLINWQLATLDENIRKIEKQMRRSGTLQGALARSTLSQETVFYDFKLGREHWDEIDVVIMSMSALETAAPVNAPMMVAGASLFAPRTVAFDLAERMLYIYPE